MRTARRTRSVARCIAVTAAVVLCATAAPAAATPAGADIAAAQPQTFPRDWTGDGHADVLAIGGAGVLFVYPGNGRGGFLARRAIGHGWQHRDLVTTVGDLDVDGRPDLVARNPANGDLLLYRGNGTGGFLGTRLIGRGWNAVDMLFGPGNHNNDSGPDLIARERDSFPGLRLYPGDGEGGVHSFGYLGYGWQGMTALAATGDWNGQGMRDFVARDTAGTLWLYEGNRYGELGGRTAIGKGWHVFTAIVGPGDWNGDGTSDLLARHRDGRLVLYPGTGTGGFGASRQIGAGWGAFRLVA